MKKTFVRYIAVLIAALMLIQIVGVTVGAEEDEAPEKPEIFYNVTSSFSEPTSTRHFSWTADATLVGDDEVVVKYRRHKGALEWTFIDAELIGLNEKELYYRADITGIASTAEFEYVIGKKGSEDYVNDWSPLYEFRTAYDKQKSFSFIAMGGTRIDGTALLGDTNYLSQTVEAALLDVPSPAFILNMGDFVENGEDAEQWKYYFSSFGELLTDIPHFAVRGESDDALGFYNHFNLPALAPFATDGAVYSYTIAGVHFVVVGAGYAHETVSEWLLSDLEANADAVFTVVAVYEPMYDESGSRNTLCDIYEDNGVDLVIQGSADVVSRTYPLKGGERVDGDGTVYVTIADVARGSATVTRPTEITEHLVAPSADASCYAAVSVSRERIIFEVKQTDGTVLDRFVIGEEEVESETEAETVTESATETEPMAETETNTEIATETEMEIETETEDIYTVSAVIEAPTTEALADQKGGCGSSVGVTALALVAALGACAAITRKKRE